MIAAPEWVEDGKKGGAGRSLIERVQREIRKLNVPESEEVRIQKIIDKALQALNLEGKTNLYIDYQTLHKGIKTDGTSKILLLGLLDLLEREGLVHRHEDSWCVTNYGAFYLYAKGFDVKFGTGRGCANSFAKCGAPYEIK